MALKASFGRFWDRLSRSVPVLGIAHSLLSRPMRVERAAEDDAAYRAMAAQLGIVPLFPHNSVRREKVVILGELAGHLLALLLAVVLWLAFRSYRYLFPFTWAVAFVGDWAVGRLAAVSFHRRQNADQRIAEQLRQVASEAARGEPRDQEPPVV